MFLLDVGEESRVRQIPLPARAAELSLCLFLRFGGFKSTDEGGMSTTLLLTHALINYDGGRT